MPECTNLDLVKARKAADMKQWELSVAISASKSTIQRWESGETVPGLDDVDAIEIATKANGLWWRWARSHYGSIRRRFAELPNVAGLHSSMSVAKHEMKDVLDMHERVERAVLCGRVVDLPDYEREVDEALASLTKLKSEIRAARRDV